jgi:hypothetical protein
MGNIFNKLGYISGYTLNSEGLLSGSLNTLDDSNKSSTISLSSTLGTTIENVWGITSPNKNDQLLVMTNDSKYIYISSYLFGLIAIIFANYLPPEKDKLPQYTTQSIVYIGLYFILTYNFGSTIPFIKIIEMILPFTNALTDKSKEPVIYPQAPIQTLSSTASPTNTPSYTPSYNDEYNTWDKLGSSQPMDKLIKDSYLFYTVCSDIAVNGKLSQYYSKFDDTIITANKILPTDWTYAANFFYTIYTFGNNKQLNFCITTTDSKAIPALAEAEVDCRLNAPASSLINTPAGPYGQGGAAALLVNNKWTVLYIIIGILLCCCCLGSLVFVMVASSKSGRHRHRNSGGYFYLD